MIGVDVLVPIHVSSMMSANDQFNTHENLSTPQSAPPISTNREQHLAQANISSSPVNIELFANSGGKPCHPSITLSSSARANDQPDHP